MSVTPNSKKFKEFVQKNPDYRSPTIPLPETTAAMRVKMPDFIAACDDMGVKPTKRQAAKYNAKRNRWSENRSRVLN